MKSFLSLQKFQEDDTQVWAINCTQRKEQLFSRKIFSGTRNCLNPVSIEWGGFRRIRAHRVKEDAFVGTQIRKLICDSIFESKLNKEELAAWKSFVEVIK
ncbi:hypothetical protein AVEN_115355-1 [Araneus ventricosus]|uniref:Uncharacterized protein n=1 Tax=Araneus ventricosus TaxID=182803 RepID=A0A4Y2A043_ARAVE|nr:hypothetical protein AVEN_115355-1 [Araneus ventricosus]